MENVKKKRIPVMPEPPDFLLQKSVEEATLNLSENQPAEKPVDAPRTVDYLLYHTAIEERKTAEVRTAEIYSKYLEMVAFSERLLRRINRFEIYKTRVRQVYEHALRVDEIALDNLKLARRDLDNSQKIITDMNLEMHSLRASIQAHQEAFEQMSKQTGQAQAAMEYAHEQFQLLSSEYESRGEQIKELEKKFNGASSQIKELSEKYKESVKKADYLHDQHLLISNELREAQLKESAVATLNEDLTNAIPKLQKQIHVLEDKLRAEREESERKIAVLENEVERLRENRLVDALVEKSKKTVAVSEPPKTLGNKMEEKIANKEKWNQFYNKWNQIIGELSSHSAPLKPIKEENLDDFKLSSEQLVSERGDVEFF